MRKRILAIFMAIFVAFSLSSCSGDSGSSHEEEKKTGAVSNIGSGSVELSIISGSENKEVEEILEEFSKENNISLEMTYMGSVDIMRELKKEDIAYDAVWPASSIWISMGDEAHRTKHQTSISISPLAFGIKKPLAQELGFVDKEVSTEDIARAIRDGKLKFCMSSASQSNSGASAYLGFLYGLAGNPEVLTEDHLNDPAVKEEISQLLSGVERSSGSSEWLKDLFLKGDYDAMVNYESLIITTNQELVKEGKDPLYLVYPYDGTNISDSPLAYVDRGDEEKEEAFLKLSEYLQTKEVQDKLQKLGRRTGYQGVFPENREVFESDWGIDTEKVLTPIKMPSTEVMSTALNLYQTNFRKPPLTIYCLDFSGSMAGEGEKEVKDAMDLVLNQERAKSLLIQANRDEVNYVICFNSSPYKEMSAEDGSDESLSRLNQEIGSVEASGGTNMYSALNRAMEILDQYNLEDYSPAIVVLSDGLSGGSYQEFEKNYQDINSQVPIFSIMFADADKDQLDDLANLSQARVFDGREDVVSAFRSVKGYN